MQYKICLPNHLVCVITGDWLDVGDDGVLKVIFQNDTIAAWAHGEWLSAIKIDEQVG